MSTTNNLPATQQASAPAVSQANSLEAYAANLKTKMEMGTMILRSGMCPAHFKTAESVVTAMWYGQEMGFSPMQSLQLIHVINGKPTVAAAGLQAKAIQNGGVIEEMEHTDTICRLKVTRGKLSREFSFSVDEASKMGLLVKDNWKRMPKDMLYARAVSRGVRAMFADKIAGLNSTEEILDSIDISPAPAPQVEGGTIVIPADELPPKLQTFKYCLVGLDVEKVPAATKLLLKEGAQQIDDVTFVTDHRIPKLDNFAINDGIELNPEEVGGAQQ